MIKKLLAAAAFAAIVPAMSANAATFTFSFSNEDGPVAGDVSGVIELPDGDGVFQASSVLVTALPAALGYGGPPIDFLTAGFVENLFTVAGGAITGVSFTGLLNGSTALFLSSDFIGGITGIDALDGADLAATGVLDIDSSTLTFASAVPVPAALPLMAAGLGAFGFMGWRRKRAA